MKNIIAIAFVVATLLSSAAEAKTPTACKKKGQCETVLSLSTKKQMARLKQDIAWARSAAQILERACSSHVYLPLSAKTIEPNTVHDQLRTMKASIESAQCIVCAHKRDRHEVEVVEQLMRKKWAEVDYLLVQAEHKLHVMQLAADTITPGEHSEEGLNFNLEAYGRNAAQFNELLEEVKVQIAVIEALSQLR